MKLLFERSEEEDLNLRIETTEGDIKEFDYIYFIKKLYEGEEIELINFPDDLDEIHKENIKLMIDKINEKLNSTLNLELEESIQTGEEAI